MEFGAGEEGRVEEESFPGGRIVSHRVAWSRRAGRDVESAGWASRKVREVCEVSRARREEHGRAARRLVRVCKAQLHRNSVVGELD